MTTALTIEETTGVGSGLFDVMAYVGFLSKRHYGRFLDLNRAFSIMSSEGHRALSYLEKEKSRGFCAAWNFNRAKKIIEHADRDLLRGGLGEDVSNSYRVEIGEAVKVYNTLGKEIIFGKYFSPIDVGG